MTDEKTNSEHVAAVNSPMPTINDTGEPWNVLREKAGLAAGLNTYVETKTAYDQNFPPPPPAGTRTGPDPATAPIGEPISAGHPIVPDPAKYIVDRTVADRIKRRI